MKILISGASGLVGRTLMRELQIAGHDVYALARTPSKIIEIDSKKVFKWDSNKLPPANALKDVDAIIHLAGEGIADKPWTEKRKKDLRNSRIVTTKNLVEAIKAIPESQRPKALISASAIGYYGEDSEKTFDESSSAGTGFLAELCQDWEQSSQIPKEFNVRVVNSRFGLILSKEGGFLNKMAPVVLGSGKQWMSWVHIDDVIQFMKHAVSNQNYIGPYNLTSPYPLRNNELTKLFSEKMGFPFFVKAPEFILKLVLGEMSTAVLGSQKVVSKRLADLGFKFQFERFSDAMKSIYEGNNFLDNYHNVDQFVPVSKDKVFNFFSRAENLEVITPPWLNFKITRKSSEEISKDSVIDYKLKIHGVPVTWKTLISEWQPDEKFVDDQVNGPYKKWHHLHLFHSVQGGTLLRDEVTFKVPGSIFGKLLLTAWIKKDVRTIFSYRQKMIEELQKQNRLN